LNYQFNGDIDFGKAFDMLDAFNLPFDKNGSIKLLK